MSSYPTVLKAKTLVHRVDHSTAEAPLRAERTDKQLVDLVLSGDNTAFEQIFERHKRLVAVIARRYFRRPEEDEEIVQISFAKVFVELGKFRGIHDRSLSSWLVRITSNACFDVLRSQKRKPEQLECDLTENETGSLLDLAAGYDSMAEQTVIDRDLVDKLLARVPNEDRILLRMMYAEEMSVADIGAALGWSTAKVKIKAWRARGALRKILKKYL